MCGHGQGRKDETAAEKCNCPGASVSPRAYISRFVQPCLLLLLFRKPAHGYELLDDLEQVGFDRVLPEPAAIYKCLRRFEEEGLVESEWDTEGTGPARRIYKITPEGEEMLQAWLVSIRQNMKALEKFIAFYTRLSAEKEK